MADAFQQSPTDYQDKTGNNVTIWSKSGKRYTEAQYDHAFDKHVAGKPLQDFIVLPSGSAQPAPTSLMGKLTQGYEQYVNQPLQRFAAGSTPETERLQGVDLMRKFGMQIPPGGTNPIPAMAQSLSTPEAALATLAQGGAGLATKGMAGIVAPALIRGGAAGLGYLTGQALTRPYEELSLKEKMEPLIHAGVAAGAEGAVGVFKAMTQGSMSTRANEAVAQKVMQLIDENVPHLKNQGAVGLEAYAGTRDGLKNLTQVGVEGLKETVDDIAISFKQDLQGILGPQRVVGTGIRSKTIDKHLTEYHKAAYEMLDNLADDDIRKASMTTMDTARKGVEAVLKREFSQVKMTDPQQIAATKQLMDSYFMLDKDLKSNAIILHIMRKSGANTGFERKRFQQEILNYIQDLNPAEFKAQSPLLKRLEQIATLGQERKLSLSKDFKIPYLRKPFTFEVPFLKATTYAGMPANVGTTAGTAVSVPAIKDFLQERK